MVVRFGTKCEPGALPVFSVDTVDEANALLALACETNQHGEYLARELIWVQSLDNLQRFSDRLAAVEAFLRARRAGRTDVPYPAPPPMGFRGES